MLPAHVFLRTPRARFVEHHGGTLGCSARGHTGPPATAVLLTLACAPDRRVPPPSPRLPRRHPLAPRWRSDRGTACTNTSNRCEKRPYEDLIRSRTRLLQECQVPARAAAVLPEHAQHSVWRPFFLHLPVAGHLPLLATGYSDERTGWLLSYRSKGSARRRSWRSRCPSKRRS